MKIFFTFSLYKARIFLFVDLRDYFFRFRVGGTKKKKALKMISRLKKIIKKELFFFIFFQYLENKQ